MDYQNCFITLSLDCPQTRGVAPHSWTQSGRSLTLWLFELLQASPYRYQADEVVYLAHYLKQQNEGHIPLARAEFEQKRRYCFRSSPLVNRWGWGIHGDDSGRLALYPADSEAYAFWCQSPHITRYLGLNMRRSQAC